MPYSEGTNKGASTNTAIIAVVALTIAGVMAVIGVLVFGGRAASTERVTAIIAAVFAFITPTIAALLAFLRASDAQNTAQTAAVVGIATKQQVDDVSATVNEVHNKIVEVNGTVNERLANLETGAKESDETQAKTRKRVSHLEGKDE